MNSGNSNFYHRVLRQFGASEELEEWIDNLELGWGAPPAEWLKDLCPEVVEHFNNFPSTKAVSPADLEFLPFMPTEHAAQAVSSVDRIIRDCMVGCASSNILHSLLLHSNYSPFRCVH